MAEVFDRSGNHVGYTSEGGGSILVLLPLAVALVCVRAVVRAVSPFWAFGRAHGVHPMLLLLALAAIAYAAVRTAAWLLGFAAVRLVGGAVVAAGLTAGLFLLVRAHWDAVWATGAAAAFALWAAGRVRSFHRPSRAWSG